MSAPGVNREADALLQDNAVGGHFDPHRGFLAGPNRDALGSADGLAVADDFRLEIIGVIAAGVERRGDENAGGSGRSGDRAVDIQLGFRRQADNDGCRSRIQGFFLFRLFFLGLGHFLRGRSASGRRGSYGAACAAVASDVPAVTAVTAVAAVTATTVTGMTSAVAAAAVATGAAVAARSNYNRAAVASGSAVAAVTAVAATSVVPATAVASASAVAAGNRAAASRAAVAVSSAVATVATTTMMHAAAVAAVTTRAASCNSAGARA